MSKCFFSPRAGWFDSHPARSNLTTNFYSTTWHQPRTQGNSLRVYPAPAKLIDQAERNRSQIEIQKMRQHLEREGVHERANPSLASSDPSLDNKSSDPVGKTVNEIIKLEFLEKTASERVAERIAGFTGSMFFVWLHVVWFSLWIGVNLPLLNSHPVDPFPFTFLSMIVSLEAIFLSAFILMTENRQARLADRRARVNLQIDMIAEREVTKLMQLVVEIHSHLGILANTDPELEHMTQATNIEHLTEAAQIIANRNGDLGSEKEIAK